jgi:hypothetical protein
MGVVEAPRAVAAGPDIGQYLLMIGDLRARQPRRNTMQPGLNEIVIAPRHRDRQPLILTPNTSPSWTGLQRVRIPG